MIISANIGDFDNIQEPEFGVPYRCYTDQDLPFPLPNLNNRLKGKYLKIQTHRFRDEPRWVWLDGSVQPVGKGLQKYLFGLLSDQGADVAIPLHPDRSNVYDELNYILDGMKDGRQYLIDRYAKEPLAEELEFYYRQGLPADFPLYACRMFARVNSPRVNEAFNDWWMGCLEYSNFDQTYFSYVCYKHKLKIASFKYSDVVGRLANVNLHRNDLRSTL